MTTARPNPPRLGRGLAALFGDAGSAVELEIRTLGISQLAPGPFQPRQAPDPSALEELTESIRARGILQPILARPDPDDPNRFQIIAGERRWRAAQAAGLDTVPVLIRALGDMEALAAALVENLQRQDLNAIEEAEGYRRLIDGFQMTQETLASAVGKSRSHVANTMRLLNLPGTIQAGVRAGHLSAGHARALLAHPEPERAALAVIAKGLNVRQTEALASSRSDSRGSRPARRDPDLAGLEQELTDRLGLRVDIAAKGSSGTVRIAYRSLDQLDGIIALLRGGVGAE